PLCPRSEVVELALKTITTPKASRHRVAVSSRLYSIGWAPARLRALGPRRLSESAVISWLCSRHTCANLPPGLGGKLCDQGAEVLAALFKVAIGVEAGACGGKQDDLAGRRVGRGRADRAREPLAAANLHPATPGRLEGPLERLGGVADQIAGNAPLPDRLHQAAEVLALQRAAQDRAYTVVERAQPGGGGGHVRGLGVVHVEDAVHLGDPLQPVRKAGEAAKAVPHPVVPQAHRERRGGSRHRVVGVVRADQAQLACLEERALPGEDHVLAEGDLAQLPGWLRQA